MTLLRGYLEGRNLGGLANPAADLYRALTDGLAGPANSGQAVTPTSAMRVSAALACVRLIAETLGSLPLGVYQITERGHARKQMPADEVVWRRPNPEMTQQFLNETLVGHAVLTGNAYLYKVYDGLNRLAELWPLDPRRVEVRREDGEKVFRVDGKDYDRRAITHIPGFSTDGLMGLSMVQAAREAFGLALATEEYGARFFAQGSTVAGILSVKEELDDKQADSMARRWQRLHAGARNAHRIAVLDNGATWQQVGIPPQDAQFLETRKFQIAEIARIFRVPPHLIGDVERSTSWGSGIEEQTLAFITYTLRPWLRRLESAYSDDVLAVRDRVARFDTDDLLRGKASERWDVYRIARTIGALNVDEIRAKEGEAPISDGSGSDYRQPLNSNVAAEGERPDRDGGAGDDERTTAP
ncbi:MAG: phage portal protein [Chloroflexota bacterium]|nr:phage portal protein [Chloroflexota bacterium]